MLLGPLVEQRILVAAAIATLIAALVLSAGWVLRLNAAGALLCARVSGYSPGSVARLWAASGSQGRAPYRSFLVADAVFVPLYAATLSIGLAYFARQWLGIAPQDAWLCNAPLLAGCADWAEDGLLGYALARFPRRADRSVSLASLATRAKWSLLFASGAIAMFGIARWLRDMSGT